MIKDSEEDFSSFFPGILLIKCKITNEEAKAFFLREDVDIVGDKFYHLCVDLVVHVMLILVC